MNVTASIVTIKTDPDELSAALNQLQRAGVAQTWVVDNSPTRILESTVTGKATYISTGKNLGYGSAHNIAISNAISTGSCYHLVMNTDIEFESDAVRQLAEYLDAHPSAAMVTPAMTYPDGRLQANVRLLPRPIDVFGRRFLPARWMSRANARYTLLSWSHATELDIPYHQGSFMLFRTGCLADEGGFDERFFMYPEDIDITRRMHRRWSTIYYPRVKIVHNHRAASYRSWHMTWVHCVNMVRYFNKWGWLFDSERRDWNRAILKSTANSSRP